MSRKIEKEWREMSSFMVQINGRVIWFQKVKGELVLWNFMYARH